MTDKEARKLAEAHWEWLESLLHKIYVDAMVHGFRHGYEACQSNEGIKHGGEEIMRLAISLMGLWILQDALASICYYPSEKWRWNHIARLVRVLIGLALIVMGIMV